MPQQTIVVPPPPTPVPAPPTTDAARMVSQAHAEQAALAQAVVRDMQAHDPEAILRGLKAQREVLGEQLDNIQRERESVVETIRESRNQGMPVEGLETNLAELDKRILSVHQQIAVSDNAVALASAVPGAVAPEPKVIYRDNDDEAESFVAGMSVVLALMVPYVLFRRWRARRRGPAATALPAESNDRLRAIEQSVETIAVEMERIGEGQRFMSRLITERGGFSALGEGAAKPVELPQRERAQTPVR